VKNVPSLGGEKELIELFAQFGEIEEYQPLFEHKDADKFTDVYWIKYQNITSAQEAKRKNDQYPFLGTSPFLLSSLKEVYWM
jgi:hypothetical protein